MSTEHYRQAAILAALVDSVRSANHSCGETLLQKSAYVMKELFDVALTDPFRIHYYGPFSFQLRDRLASMEADDIVRARPRDLGVTYETGERYGQLQRRFKEDIAAAAPAIAFVTEHLAPLGVKQLEPLATALFVTREASGASIEGRAKRLCEIKQHISDPEARKALETVDGWISELTSPNA